APGGWAGSARSAEPSGSGAGGTTESRRPGGGSAGARRGGSSPPAGRASRGKPRGTRTTPEGGRTTTLLNPPRIPASAHRAGGSGEDSPAFARTGRCQACVRPAGPPGLRRRAAPSCLKVRPSPEDLRAHPPDAYRSGMVLTPGLTGSVEAVVGPADTARALGS